jgi:Uncharacterized protein conserved in bacteria (DUF2059)
MKLRTLLAAALFAAVCSAPAIASAQAAPAAAPIDPERRALAHELIDEMNIPKLLHDSFGKAFGGSSPFARSTDGFDGRQYALSMTAGLEAILPEILDQEADAYAQLLSTEDLRAAVAFYRSPAAKALLAATPEVTERVTPAIYGAMPKMQAAIFDDYCKHATCSEALRAQFKREEESMAQMLNAAHPAK